MSSFSVCFLVVYRKVINLCKLIMYPDILLNLFISFRSFQVEFLGSLLYSIMSSANRDPLLLILFVTLNFLSYLIATASTLNTVLKRRRIDIPGFSGIAEKFSPLRMMLDVGSLCINIVNIVFIVLKYVSSRPTFSKTFIMKACWIVSTAFSAYVEMVL